MNKFVYHYSCLFLSAIQLITTILGVYATISGSTNYHDGSIDITAAIFLGLIFFIALFFMAIIDKFLRGVKNEGFFSDCLLLTLVSPFRFICEIITIIRLYIAERNGDYYFGERGCTTYYFNEYIYYYFFNCELD